MFPVDSNNRWPVLRSGDRDEIPWLLRKLVYMRDAERCRSCGSEHELQLDHVVPWSANGLDVGSNLQTLCADCNMEKSNFRMNPKSRIQAVTPFCDHCLRDHASIPSWWHNKAMLSCEVCRFGGYEEFDERIVAWCGACDCLSRVSHHRRLM